MRKKLVMTSAFHRPPARTGREGPSRFCREGDRHPRHAACVCLGETLTNSVHLEATNRVFPVKILNLVCLIYDKKKT